MLLITGGTGSLGTALIAGSSYKGRIRSLSRDEQKIEKLRTSLDPMMGVQLVMGDVRDMEKMLFATRNVDTIVHAAALKVIPSANYNLDEHIKTNVTGTWNVIQAAILNGVSKILYVSTDKACEPSTTYGATKMLSEQLCVLANSWSETTDIACVRYGNVVDSRGSFTHRLKASNRDEVLPITDPDCTRFWITLDMAVKFVDFALGEMQGGEIFVPRLKGVRLGDMIPEGVQTKVVGLRGPEKVHEVLVGAHEIRHTDVYDEHMVIRPWPHQGNCLERTVYRSNGDENWGRD